MNKLKISAREALNDIRSGMNDGELMKKYNLTAKGLESLFRKLIEAKVLGEKFIANRAHPRPAGGRSDGATASKPQSKARVPERPPKLHVKIARDVKEGVHSVEIMRRYELSPGQ